MVDDYEPAGRDLTPVSLDLQVYGSQSLEPDSVPDAVATIEGTRAVTGGRSGPAGYVIERRLRGQFEYLASLDGPFAVESEDLPSAVVANAIGTKTSYHLSVPAGSKAGFDTAQRVARSLAAACSGVVYDPQLDAVTWPRSRQRLFDAPKATRIDVVEFSWYVRRSDAPVDLASVLLGRMEQLLPEAIPRRFGGFEPLQHTYETEGADGFIRCWRDEPSMFWKGSAKPCFEGSVAGLGQDAGWAGVEHPVGTIHMTIDGRAFDEEPWQRVLVDFFVAVSAASGALAAVAEVARNLRLSRGSLSHGPEAESTWGLVVRNEWMGLPVEQPWLLWLNPAYGQFLGLGDNTDAVFLRGGDRPPLGPRPRQGPKRRLRLRRDSGDGRSAVPTEARMTVSGDPIRGGERHRARSVPDWL